MSAHAFNMVSCKRLSARTIPEDVVAQLTLSLAAVPKRLHPSLCYDAAGSVYFAELCRQPEYYLTRTEHRLLRENADHLVQVADATHIVDLGCGNFHKTETLIAAGVRQQGRIVFQPCDIDVSIIESSLPHLAHFHGESVTVEALVGSYEACLESIDPQSNDRRMYVFLGSTLGNMSRDEQARLLRGISGKMRSKDTLLIGIDLVKPVRDLEAAYNDHAGFAQMSTLQMLCHMNEKFGGSFNPSHFGYAASFNMEKSRIEVCLISKQAQRVPIPGLNIVAPFFEGERIHAEFMEKFRLPDILERLQTHSLAPVTIDVDEAMPYALILLRRKDGV